MIWSVGLVNMGSVGQTLTPAQQEQFNRATDILPPCWSQEAQDCVDGKNKMLPDCDELNAIYDKKNPEVYAAIKGYVDAMPICPVPGPTPDSKPGVSPAIAFGAGVVVTMLVATLVL